MSIKHRGPIGEAQLQAFCIDRIFRFPKEPQPNRKSINCKICGGRELPGDGREVYILDARYFLCPDCTLRVCEAKETFTPPEQSHD